MKLRSGLKPFGVIAATLLLVGCAAQSATPADVAAMQNAPAPSSNEAAQEAVKRYFADSLFDAPAARYEFPLPPVRGVLSPLQIVLTTIGEKQAGWFMCGRINGKNRMGGYTGWEIFLAHFSPTIRDSVIDGTIDDDKYHFIAKRCESLYKQP